MRTLSSSARVFILLVAFSAQCFGPAVCFLVRPFELNSELSSRLSLGKTGKVRAKAQKSELCEKLVENLNYTCLEYELQTPDGFLLALHRILPSNENPECESFKNQRRKPVLLQHGLLVGAESWLLLGSSSLPFLFVKRGFDVFLGNTRGSRWNFGHVVWREKSRKFWNWSSDEIAAFDLPAIVRAVQLLSERMEVSYVAHSQGTLVVLDAISSGLISPSLFSSLVLISPIAYLGNLRAPFLREILKFDFDKLVSDTGIYEFNLNNPLGKLMVARICLRSSVDCSHILSAITGENCCVDVKELVAFLRFLPSSTSVKNLKKYAQAVRVKLWQKYDYGPLRNKLFYGQAKAPEYAPGNLHALCNSENATTERPLPYDPRPPSTSPPKTRAMFLLGGKDDLSTLPDVFRLLSEIRCSSDNNNNDDNNNNNNNNISGIKDEEISENCDAGGVLSFQLGTPLVKILPEYAHVDFIFGQKAAEDVYGDVVDFVDSSTPPSQKLNSQ